MRITAMSCSVLTIAVLAAAAAGLLQASARPGLAAGCYPARAHASGTSVQSITTVDGARSYRLHVPPSYTGTSRVALIINMHGITMTAIEEEFYSGMSTRSDQPGGGFIAVYPEGLNFAGPDTQWFNVTLASPTPDDLGFIAAILDELEGELCIDNARIYSSGLSNGAMMSVRLACSLSSRIAAVALIGGAYYPPIGDNPEETCPDTRAAPVIAFHGTADTYVPFDGGLGGVPGLGSGNFRLAIDNTTPAEPDDDVMESWATHNGCTGGRTEASMPPEMTEIQLVEYGSCTDGAIVQLYIIDPGGHTWPGSTFDVPVLGYRTLQINATDLMWQFFQAHPHPNPPGPAPDVDGDTVPDSSDTDIDNDGCTNVREGGGTQSTGGLRNAKNFWDFFDTPDASNVRDKSVAGTDFFRVLARFGSSGDAMIDPLSAPPAAPAYHTAFDRGASSGPNAWNLTAADGSIAGTDFFAILTQFGHTCA